MRNLVLSVKRFNNSGCFLFETLLFGGNLDIFLFEFYHLRFILSLVFFDSEWWKLFKTFILAQINGGFNIWRFVLIVRWRSVRKLWPRFMGGDLSTLSEQIQIALLILCLVSDHLKIRFLWWINLKVADFLLFRIQHFRALVYLLVEAIVLL